MHFVGVAAVVCIYLIDARIMDHIHVKYFTCFHNMEVRMCGPIRDSRRRCCEETKINMCRVCCWHSDLFERAFINTNHSQF
jgi:hypothetical protein